MQYAFGSGLLWGTPLQDAYGAQITNPTPILFGTLQDTAIDISFETKTLHGQSQFPVSIGRGKGKITGKAKFAQINGQIFNGLFFGQTIGGGRELACYDTVGQIIPAEGPAKIKVDPPGDGTFLSDLGVISDRGLPLVRVERSPSPMQYALGLDSGEYIFSAVDATNGMRVFINYKYMVPDNAARHSVVRNVPMGYAPTFRADFSAPFQGKSLTLTLPNCIGGKLGFSAKNDDFSVPEFDFEAFADEAGQILIWSTSE